MCLTVLYHGETCVLLLPLELLLLGGEGGKSGGGNGGGEGGEGGGGPAQETEVCGAGYHRPDVCVPFHSGRK